MKFSIKDFSGKCEFLQFPADLVTLTEEIPNRKLHFLCSVYYFCKNFQQRYVLQGGKYTFVVTAETIEILTKNKQNRSKTKNYSFLVFTMLSCYLRFSDFFFKLQSSIEKSQK